jgi:hypothetical protein
MSLLTSKPVLEFCNGWCYWQTTYYETVLTSHYESLISWVLGDDLQKVNYISTLGIKISMRLLMKRILESLKASSVTYQSYQHSFSSWAPTGHQWNLLRSELLTTPNLSWVTSLSLTFSPTSIGLHASNRESGRGDQRSKWEKGSNPGDSLPRVTQDSTNCIFFTVESCDRGGEAEGTQGLHHSLVASATLH